MFRDRPTEKPTPVASRTGSTSACLRCGQNLPESALYCPACGVSVALAASGEFPTFDFERFFQFAVDLLCIAGTDGFFKVVNPSFTRVLGYSMDELLARPFLELVHPDDRDATVAEIEHLADGTVTLAFSNRYRHRDGGYVRLQWNAYPESATGLIYAVGRVAPGPRLSA
jgi:PAS domain S-box-containing protein